MNDPGLDNLDRELAAMKAHTMVRNERWWWEHRRPGDAVIVFEGAEKWKLAPIAAGELVLCGGCEVPKDQKHYHQKGEG
jgi:hypothetical protein